MTAAVLQISPELALPADAITETFGILAVKRAGKSNAGVVMAEEMFRAGLPWVAIDPKGDWWGLRSSGDGNGPGLPIVVFGGLHADVPLEPAAGQLVADIIVDQRLTCVVDVSEMSRADQRRFLTPFIQRLYRQADAEPLHLFLEEAHEYLPQMVRGDDAAMVGAWERLVKRGGFRGLGCTLITQRAASLNNDVLTQVQTLIALRTTGVPDRKRIEEWVSYHQAGKDLVQQLPTLADGEALVFSPNFLRTVRKIRFRRRSTFDSGATPKVGIKTRPPAILADVDLDTLRGRMAAIIEKAKADDPRELRKRITDLERQLRDSKASAAVAAPRVVEKVVEVPVVDLLEVGALSVQLVDVVERFVQTQMKKSAAPVARPTEQPQRVAPASIAPPRAASRPVSSDVAASNGHAKLGAGERKVLAVLAQWPDGRVQKDVAFLAGYSAKASTIGVILSNLRRAGLVFPGQPVKATPAGIEAAGGVEELPSGPELLEHWMRHPRIGAGERKVLRALIEAYPDALSHAELCELTNYSPEASTIGVILSKLRKLGLVEPARRRVPASFMEAIA